MKKKKRKISRNVTLGNVMLVLTLFLFLILLYRASVLSLSSKVDGIDLKSFSSSHTIKHETILAKRGSIYDVNGDYLAQNVYSYTLLAYLSPSRGEGNYVKDKEETARKLSEVIDLSYEKILSLLNATNKSGNPLYQTEFGVAGRGLTEIMKEKIESLNLPGIGFIEKQKRYYPKGDFLSYTLGYAKVDDEGKITGEMGIESLYDKELTGTDGFREYQKDLKGYKIANTPESIQDAEDGNDIYLTVDSNVQFFIEQALSDVSEMYEYDEINVIVAEAKTGKVLGIGSTTSFDPNIKNIKSYLDPNISVSFEPGSTMKIFTYMAALETGKYDGEKTFKSGTYETKDGTVIGDSNRNGWGVISFDRGFALSSNVGVVNLINNYLSREYLTNYFKKLGFGSKTGIELSKETSGKINFKYETELYNAGFGQGILVTSIQNIQALTSIANDGIMLQPYIVDKIVDSKGNIILENTKKEVGRVASKETTDKMKDLLESVINDGTAINYKMDGYNLIGKTGTAQISSTNGTGYLKGKEDYIRGFAGMFPKEDPQIIIYANLVRSTNVKPLVYVVKDVIENVSKYYKIYDEDSNISENSIYKLEKYYNKATDSVKKTLESKGIDVVTIGNGNMVINQYPNPGVTVTKNAKVFLVTNSNLDDIIIPDFKGWSKKNVYTYLDLAHVLYKGNGMGYLVNQSIVNEKIEKGQILELTFEEKFNEEKSKE